MTRYFSRLQDLLLLHLLFWFPFLFRIFMVKKSITEQMHFLPLNVTSFTILGLESCYCHLCSASSVPLLIRVDDGGCSLYHLGNRSHGKEVMPLLDFQVRASQTIALIFLCFTICTRMHFPCLLTPSPASLSYASRKSDYGIFLDFDKFLNML